MIVESQSGSVEEVSVSGDRSDKFCLNDEQAVNLATIGMKVRMSSTSS